MSEYDDMIAAALHDAGVIEDRSALALTDDQLGNISDLSTEMMRLEDYLAKIEALSKAATASLVEVRERLLPDAMDNAGVKSIQLKDGSSLSVSMKYIGSISKDNEEAALEWFKSSGRIGAVTPILTVDTQKGHLEQAEGIYKMLIERDISCTLKPSVHWQTLRAVVRELYEAGDAIPECLSTYVINEAKIKRKG